MAEIIEEMMQKTNNNTSLIEEAIKKQRHIEEATKKQKYAGFGQVEIRSTEGKGPYYLQAQEKIEELKATVETLEALVAEMYDGKENMKSLPEENDRKLSSPKFLPFVPFISSLPDELMGLEDRIRSAINQIKKGM